MRVRTIIFSLSAILLMPSLTMAASQDECAIWLCLPGGFPSGCERAYEEFVDRIKHGRPPLPDLASCTNEGKTNGRYEMGYELFEPCREGYVLLEPEPDDVSYRRHAMCYQENCAPSHHGRNDNYCPSYEALKRPKPRFVKMWVDREYLGQFFY